MRIIATTASGHLVKNSGLKPVSLERRHFSDGDMYLRLLEPVAGRRVLVASATHAPGENFLELMFLARLIKENGGQPVIFIPYLGYCRSDRVVRPGELFSLRLVADVLNMLDAPVVLLDVHQTRSLRLFKKARHIYALPYLAGALSKAGGFDRARVVIVAPDGGAWRRARELARLLKVKDVVVIRKRRLGNTRVVHEKPDIDLRGRHAIVVDDILDTGTTLYGVARILRRLGARRVTAVITHGMFSGSAMKDFGRSGIDRLYVTDSIGREYRSKKITVVSIAPLLKTIISHL